MSTFDAGQDDFFVRETPERPAPESTSHIKAVVLDLGGVVLANGPRMGLIARLLGRTTSTADQQEVEAAIWKFRTEYDLGEVSSQEYWQQVADEVNAADSLDVNSLVSAEADRWGRALPDAIDLLDRLEHAPVKLAALCNAPAPLARAFDDQEWAEGFAAARFSSREGIMVPDEAMLRRIEKDLGVEPEEIVFYDNNPDHVTAAAEHGWDAREWQGGRSAIADLEELGVLS